MSEKEIEGMAEDYVIGYPNEMVSPDGEDLYDRADMRVAYQEGIEDYLRAVWHESEELPQVPDGERYVRILVQSKYTTTTVLFCKEVRWASFCNDYIVSKWAYIEDLVPKKNWSTE